MGKCQDDHHGQPHHQSSHIDALVEADDNPGAGSEYSQQLYSAAGSGGDLRTKCSVFFQQQCNRAALAMAHLTTPERIKQACWPSAKRPRRTSTTSPSRWSLAAV